MIVSEGSIVALLGKALYFVVIGWVGWVTHHVLGVENRTSKAVDEKIKESKSELRAEVKQQLDTIDARTARIETILLEKSLK